MTPGEIEAWIRLSASGLSPVRQRALLEAFGGAEQVLSASDEALVGVEGLGALHVRKLRHALEAVDAAEIRERIAERGWQLVPLTSREYPERLREIADAPSVLMVEGDLGPSDALAVSVVGTRKCSDYARRLARRLSYDLAARGVTVVSGMALGVDGEAHRGAIEAGGRTVAVLGCGLDITYPPQHAELRSEIAASGAVISALPLGTAPTRDQFPRRNRIISGLSVGVVVVEAPVGSGALITAQLAAEQGREVFVVPGDVTRPESRGSNELIRDGATLVQSADDVLEGLDVVIEAAACASAGVGSAAVELPPDEATVYAAMATEGVTVDDLVETTGLDAGRTMAALMLLEIKGLIRRFGSGTYSRVD